MPALLRRSRFALPLFILVPLHLAGCTAGVAPTTTPTQISATIPAAADTVLVPTDFWSTRGGNSYELYSMGGAVPTRLTYCLGCQATGVAPSLERNRIALRRANSDSNGDGKFDDFDASTLLLVDLARQIEGPFLPEGWNTSSVDWSSDGTTLVHTSSPDGSPDDIYAMDNNGANNRRLTGTPTVRERGARLNAAITRVVYERIDGVAAGKSEIWVFLSNTNQQRLTDSGVSGGAQLPGTYYLVGSDAGPDYSPDAANVVFRRLTSTSVAGGTWDILVVPAAGGAPSVLASGPQFRSNPDWSNEGIVFTEQNLTSGGMDVVVINPATGARRVLQSLPSGYRAGSPRWIAGIAG